MTRFSKNSPLSIGNGEIQHETEKAVLVLLEAYGSMWVPKSAIHDNSEAWDMQNATGDFIVKEWWAEKAGLV